MSEKLHASAELPRARQKNILGRAKDTAVGGIVWAAEKSTLVTLPAAALIVAFTPLTLAAAGPFMAADGGGFLLFRGIRNRRKHKELQKGE